YTRALEILDEGFEDALQYLSQPEPYQISLRTTNSLERLNQEIRRRERVVRIFPNEAAAERLFGAILQDYHDQWQEQKRTFLRDFSPEFQ
ncbi:transposase, partial [Ligilactobacillus salitolerans]|uniref:transposase n=1 Tax=Ligilactobacillus salitolerans TaxID=1808352 RepID=UPI00157FAC6B